MEDPNPWRTLAAPGEDDLDDQEQRQHQVHHDSPPLESREDREEEEQNRCEEDDVAKAVVEVEAVRELVLVQRLVIVRLHGGVKRAVARRPDLHQHGQDNEPGPVAVDGSERLHGGASLTQCEQPEPQPAASSGEPPSSTWKEWPQPQEAETFGLLMAKPACRPSTQSISVPAR